MTTKEAIVLSLRSIGGDGYGGIPTVHTTRIRAVCSIVATIPGLKDMQAATATELIRQKLVDCIKIETGYTVVITPKGAYRLLQHHVNTVDIQEPVVWDRTWMVITFDIPKGKNKERVFFNRRLRELNFFMLQRNLWVHPYNCKEALLTITDYLNISRYVVVMKVETIDDASTTKLLKHFELSS